MSVLHSSKAEIGWERLCLASRVSRVFGTGVFADGWYRWRRARVQWLTGRTATDTPRTFCHATKRARCIRHVENFSMCPDSPRFFRRATKEARAIGRVEKFSTCPKSQRNGRHMTKKARCVESGPKIPTRVSSESRKNWVTFRILHKTAVGNLKKIVTYRGVLCPRTGDFRIFWIFWYFLLFFRRGRGLAVFDF